MNGKTDMGKQDFPHREPRLPAKGLLERASDMFDFRSALKGSNLPPLDVPAEMIPPPPVVAPAVSSASAPAKSRAADWPTRAVAVNRDALAQHGFLIPGAPISGLAEEFRIIKRELLAQVREAGEKDDGKVVLVASAHPDEGKTYCAVNLAVSLAAENGLEVLLVDADVAKREVADLLGLRAETGLLDVLANPALSVEDQVIRTDLAGLAVLPAGAGNAQDAEYLSSGRMKDVIKALVLARPERIVIMDSAPLLAASAASILAAHVDLTLLIVRADRTTETALRDAAELLKACPEVQLLLNGVKFSASGRRFGSYYGREG